MKILMVHNRYLIRGGEDLSCDMEAQLLEAGGHTVLRYEESNARVSRLGGVRTALRCIWSAESYRNVCALIRAERPDVMHVQNFFPLISPSVYYAARRYGVAVVQTLRNYRLTCLNGYLLREGRVCEKCLGRRFAWPGIVYGCYRGSRWGSLAVAAMQTVHRAVGTWRRKVDVYVVLTRFARDKFGAVGLPVERMEIKPNTIASDPGPGADARDTTVLFVGRLGDEKGIETLLSAWVDLDTNAKLVIAGEGPWEARVRALAARPGARIEVCGRVEHAEALRRMQRAMLLVFPSVWFEGMPRTIVEAQACATPVLASRLGAMPEMIRDGETGYLVAPGAATDLRARLKTALADPAELRRLGRNARRHFEQEYTPARNVERLEEIYATACRRSGMRKS